MDSNKSKIMASVIAGAAIGVVLGILFALDKGKNTRDKLKQKTIDTASDVSETIKQTTEELSTIAHQKKMKFDKKIDATLSSLSYKVEDVINALELKLEELKKKNASLQK
jgi:gas vesicle protein